MTEDIPRNVEARIDWLVGEVQRLHHRVMTLQAGNLARLNAWRQDMILELCSDVNLGVAFNGQVSKHECFREIFSIHPHRLAIETGTHLGHTTSFLAQHFGHVVTFEVDGSLREQAIANCAGSQNISFIHGDSKHMDEIWPDTGLPLEDVDFAYLDAHWLEHCPLRQELSFILARATNAIVFIDDFRVYDDDAYGYDRYSTLTLELQAIEDIVRPSGMALFYPSRRGILDTSTHFAHLAPRGALVIAPARIAEGLSSLSSLRRVPAEVYSIER